MMRRYAVCLRRACGVVVLAAGLLAGAAVPSVAQADLVGCRSCPHVVSPPAGRAHPDTRHRSRDTASTRTGVHATL